MTDVPASLRELARARLRERLDAEVGGLSSAGELQRLVEELRIHQVELELQNEELQRAQQDLESLHANLRGSERRYRELYEQAPVGFLRLDRRGFILELNGTAAEIFGVERAALSGRKLSDLVAPESQDAYFTCRRTARARKRAVSAEISLLSTAMGVRYAQILASPVASSAGAEDEIRVALLDVTDRVLAETQLSASEKTQRLLAEALPIPISYVAADGRIVFCNEVFRGWHAVQESGCHGRTLLDVAGLSMYSVLSSHIREALTGQATSYEGELVFPGAGERTVSILFAPDRAVDGQVRGFFQLITDLTQREQAHLALRRAASEAALSAEQERRSLAADLHDGAGQLLSVALMKLRGLQDLVGEGSGSAALREILALIHEVSRSLSTLSFELSPPLLYDVGFSAAAEWLVEKLWEQFKLRVELQVRDDLAELTAAERVTLFRSVRELLINVAKHSGTSQARLVVERDAQEAKITVSDDGVGFNPAALGKRFGLLNIHDRVTALEGRVTIVSGQGQGASISIFLPIGTERNA